MGLSASAWLSVGCSSSDAGSKAAAPVTSVGLAARPPSKEAPALLASTAVAAAAPGVAPAKRVVGRAIGSLSVKRFVVGTGVKDREPLVGREPLSSDGSPIYAFVELANPAGDSENVRVTFERVGGHERVGDVTLPVPGKVGRHRTWAFTRFVRAPGVWEAVLWSERGAELARTSFEVKPA